MNLPDNVKVLETAEFEQWLNNNTDKILACDCCGHIVYVHQETEEMVGISLAKKSEYIKNFRNTEVINIRKKNAEYELKLAYKKAIENGIDVQFTKEWFESL